MTEDQKLRKKFYDLQYRRKHKNKNLEAVKKYRKGNPDQVARQNMRYYMRHKDDIQDRQKLKQDEELNQIKVRIFKAVWQDL